MSSEPHAESKTTAARHMLAVYLVLAARGSPSAHDITLDPRGERTVVMMPGARAAWFARSEAGRAQLGHEARVLRLRSPARRSC